MVRKMKGDIYWIKGIKHELIRVERISRSLWIVGDKRVKARDIDELIVKLTDRYMKLVQRLLRNYYVPRKFQEEILREVTKTQVIEIITEKVRSVPLDELTWESFWDECGVIEVTDNVIIIVRENKPETALVGEKETLVKIVLDDEIKTIMETLEDLEYDPEVYEDLWKDVKQWAEKTETLW